MKTSIARRFALYSIGLTLSVSSSLGVAQPTTTPEICTSAATHSCCYTACINMSLSKKRIHGAPSSKLKCQKKCAYMEKPQ